MKDKWTWEGELNKAHLIQEDAGKIVGLSKSQMSQLVKRMVLGKGLTASKLDEERWSRIMEYVRFKQHQLVKEV